jgi:hypothetical protein
MSKLRLLIAGLMLSVTSAALAESSPDETPDPKAAYQVIEIRPVATATRFRTAVTKFRLPRVQADIPGSHVVLHTQLRHRDEYHNLRQRSVTYLAVPNASLEAARLELGPIGGFSFSYLTRFVKAIPLELHVGGANPQVFSIEVPVSSFDLTRDTTTPPTVAALLDDPAVRLPPGARDAIARAPSVRLETPIDLLADAHTGRPAHATRTLHAQPKAVRRPLLERLGLRRAPRPTATTPAAPRHGIARYVR